VGVLVTISKVTPRSHYRDLLHCLLSKERNTARKNSQNVRYSVRLGPTDPQGSLLGGVCEYLSTPLFPLCTVRTISKSQFKPIWDEF
jgi:hypothetical protein